MIKLGFNTAGTETVFERVLDECIERWKRHPSQSSMVFNYLEIGVAEGTTLLSVADKLYRTGYRTMATGIDLINGAFLDPRKFTHGSFEFGVQMTLMPNRFTITDGKWGGVELILSRNGTRDIVGINKPINFCLIDGCHGAPCVQQDFLLVEKAMAEGGIVAFHDAMPEDQGQGWQSHCQQNISVRNALDNLHLLDAKRPGWQFIEDVAGDKSANPPGNGFMFFQKV